MALFFDFLQFFDQITVEIPDKMEYNDTREIKGGPAVLNIVLVEPEIPQNTGNIARTCAATRSRLHLIKPLGFDISEKAVRRAGLDYWNMVDLQVYEGLDHFFEVNPAPDLWLATTKAPRDYTQAVFRDNCGAAGGISPAVPGPVYPHPDAAGRQKPESGQFSGRPHL